MAKKNRPAGGTPATVALTRAGIAFTLHEYAHDPRAESFGLEAAEALGLDPACVFKTLMASVDGALSVAIVPVSGHAPDLFTMQAALAKMKGAGVTVVEVDMPKLAELNGAVDLSGMFFPHELANLAQPDSEPVDPDGLWEGMPEFEYNPKAFKSISVHFANEDDYEAFARLIGQTLTAQTRYIWYPYREKDDLKDLRYEREE